MIDTPAPDGFPGVSIRKGGALPWRSAPSVNRLRESSRGPQPFRRSLVPGGASSGSEVIVSAGNLLSQSKNRFLRVFRNSFGFQGNPERAAAAEAPSIRLSTRLF